MRIYKEVITKAFIYAAFMLLLVQPVACAPSQVETDAEVIDGANLIKDGDFEGGGGILTKEWYVDEKITSKGTITLDTMEVHSGRYSLKLSPNERNGGDNPLAVGQHFPASKLRGKKLYLSAWMSAQDGAKAAIGLFLVDKKFNKIKGVVMTQASDRPGFHLKDEVLEIPDSKDGSLLIFFCTVEGTGGAALFDDIRLSTRPATDDLAASSEINSGGLKAEIMVDASRKIRKIPRSLFGTNVEWVWDAGGLWDKKKKAPDREIERLTRELKVSLIRFPGGVFSDFYHWRDGIGPAEKRRETTHTIGDSKSVHTFGTDEALDFAEAVGGQLFITVNAGTGTPHEAAEWVRYVNKGGVSSRKDRRVSYWEVGNELYIKDDNPASKATTMNPEKYADLYLRFAKMMRKEDPSIKIGAIGGENFGRYAFVGYPNWNKTVLSKAGREIDFLAVHNAYAPVMMTGNDLDLKTVYSAMLASPLLARENLKVISDQIGSLPKEDASRIKLAVTEWGPFFEMSPKSRYVDHTKTLGSALYVASIMKVFIESPRVEIANFFKLVENAYMGSIGIRQGRYIPKATFMALQMFTHHFGSVLVQSSTKSPVYDSPAAGLVDRVKNVPYLEAVASLSDDGKTLYVIVINKHLDSSIPAKLSFIGMEAERNGRLWTLNGTGIDANTGTELPFQKEMGWVRQAESISNPRFYNGAPGEVSITKSGVALSPRGLEYSFPPHSITAIEIRRK